MVRSPVSLQSRLAEAMAGDSATAARRWAQSGAMALTGLPDGDPLVGPARVALGMDALAAVVDELSTHLGQRVAVDGAALLGERAAYNDARRQGQTSCGGTCRLLPTADGQLIAASVPRVDDRRFLSALLGADIDVRLEGPLAVHEWDEIAAPVARKSAAAIIEQAALLGMPWAICGEVSADEPLVSIGPSDGASLGSPLTVVDLSAMWAGPLTAQLLGAAGARVVKVESVDRPDGARFGPPGFFELLHAGHESVVLDFESTGDLHRLRELIAAADIVIEASRPRALERLGVPFDDLWRTGWRGIWLSITGYGRTGSSAERVAFGDDAAVAGGLIAQAGETAVFCADAVADPATGLLGAASVLSLLASGTAGLVSVALARTAAHLAAGVRENPTVAVVDGPGVEAPRERAVTWKSERSATSSATR